MSNMGYCRFENTLEDLFECFDHLEDDDLSEQENLNRELLISLCRKIVADVDNR